MKEAPIEWDRLYSLNWLKSTASMCYMDCLKFTRLYVTVTISVESRRLETDIVTDTYRRSEF